jgi:hypothetical protein
MRPYRLVAPRACRSTSRPSIDSSLVELLGVDFVQYAQTNTRGKSHFSSSVLGGIGRFAAVESGLDAADTTP